MKTFWAGMALNFQKKKEMAPIMKPQRNLFTYILNEKLNIESFQDKLFVVVLQDYPDHVTDENCTNIVEGTIL